MKEDINRMNHLVDYLNQCNEQYRKGEPSPCSDTEFDKLLRELKELETRYPKNVRDDSPTQRIGVEPLSDLTRVKHDVPMLSIENAFNVEELKKFLDNVDKVFAKNKLGEPDYVIEYKVDGCAVSLIYENGVLVSARTRGDGIEGDDVTENAKTIASVPLTWSNPQRTEIRGEVYMPVSAFHQWNKRLKKPYANPRAATAGAIRLLDPRECAKRPLAFIAHSIGNRETVAANVSQCSFNAGLQKAGIATASIKVPDADNKSWTAPEVLEFVEGLGESFSPGDLDYETDGFVIKVNCFSDQVRLGETSTAPKWAIALKLEKYEAETVLRDVTWQVGKTGVVTPVAELEPVEIDGTTVSRATLHNLDIIERLDLKIGIGVLVEKAGKIIPRIVKSISRSKKASECKPIKPPTMCPECHTALSVEQQEKQATVVRCINPSCPAQLKERLRFYASREGVDIAGLGEQIIDQLVDLGRVKSIADLYTLLESDLVNLDRMGKKSAQKLMAAIEQSKTPPLDKFLHALTIPHTGTGTSKRLAKAFGSLDMVALASMSDLLAVPDIGEITAQAIYDFFEDPEIAAMLDRLCNELGVTPVWQQETVGGVLVGKTIVVTGTLVNYKRNEIESLIEKHGGKASGSVSKNTSFVVAGTEAGSKLDKAKQLGIPVISEDEFEAMLNK